MTIRNDVQNAFFDSSTNGQGILVSSTGAGGQLFHTASALANTFDEIWIWAQNNSSSIVTLTIQWGAMAFQNNISVNIPIIGNGLWAVIPGMRLAGGSPMYCYANVSGVITIHGYVNRNTAVVI